MHITRFADLGLRIIMACGAADEGARHTVGSLADDISAPAAHVAKVVARLGEMGLVTSTRGRGGGVSLNEQALSAQLGQVLRGLEGTTPLIDCDQPPCPFVAVDCVLRHRLAAAQEAFFDHLDATTVGELVEQARSHPERPRDLGMPGVRRQYTAP